MPVTSKAMWKKIWAMRNKYGSKAKTPKKDKWIWEDDWFKDVKFDSLPNKVNEESNNNKWIHKAKFQPDITFACWDSIHNMKNPKLSQRWMDITCPKCLNGGIRYAHLKPELKKKLETKLKNLQESIESIQDYQNQFGNGLVKKSFDSNAELPLLKDKKPKDKGLIRTIDVPSITVGISEDDENCDTDEKFSFAKETKKIMKKGKK